MELRVIKACALIAALIVIVGVGAGLRADEASHPHDGFSSDERLHAKIALNVAERGEYGDPRYVSPPAAPVLFGLAYKLYPETKPVGKLRRPDLPAAYWAQAVVGIALILAVFALAKTLAGGLAGILAAGTTAFYPPLITYTGELLTEPLAALLLMLSVLAIARAWRKWPPWRFALAGVTLGLAALTRSELLLMPIVCVVFVAVVSLRRLGPRRSSLAAGALAGGVAVTVSPWIVHASRQSEALVPITRSTATFYIGTYLPGGGTAGQLKKRFAPKERKRISDRYGKFSDATVKQAIAARYPELGDQASLAKQAREHLRQYAFGHPIRYGGMMVGKAKRLLFTRSKLSAPPSSSGAVPVHRLLMAVVLLGLVYGVWRSRDPTLRLIALAVVIFTLFHAALTEPYPRYMLKVLPLAFAGGMAGIAMALGADRRGNPPAPADLDSASALMR